MKTTARRAGLVCLLLLPILATSALAQAPQLKKQTALRSIRPVVAAQSVAVYKPAESTSLIWGDSDWVNESRTRKLYAGGLLRRVYNDVWDGSGVGTWQEFGLTEFLYQENILNRVTEYANYGAGWEEMSRTTYTSQNGTLSSMLIEQHDGSGWVNLEQSFWSYNGAELSGGSTQFWNGSGWDNFERYTLTESGTDVVETWELFDNGTWVNNTRNVYHDQTIESLTTWLKTTIEDLEDYGNMLYAFRFPAYIEQAWNGSGWDDLARLRVDRFYDVPSGTLALEAFTSEDFVGSWMPSSRYVIDYVDGAANPTLANLPLETTLQYPDGENWLDAFVESYVLEHSARKIAQSTISSGSDNWSQTRISWTNVASSVEVARPASVAQLHANYPNPVLSETRIDFELSNASQVRLEVFDLLGRSIAVLTDAFLPAGSHTVQFDTARLSAGAYWYRLEAGQFAVARQMTLIRG